MNIRILSSNIWGNCPPEERIADRNQKLSKVFQSLCPDLVGLQERSPRSMNEADDVSKLLSPAYDELPSEPYNELKHNFTPILYRKETLEVLDCGWHLYTGRNDSGSKSVSWGLFAERNGAGKLLYFNTHYYWRPDAEAQRTRVQNTKEMMELYQTLAEKYPVPAFFSGDFNCTVESEPIQNLFSEGLKDARLIAVDPVEAFRSYHRCPATAPEDTQKSSYTVGFEPDDRIDLSIDHIFVAGDAVVQHFETVRTAEALRASDHCPIYVDVTL